MLTTLMTLKNDESGFIISAELVLISTIAVIGLVTGLGCLRQSLNAELMDVGCALRSLDQSYYYTGFRSRKYWGCGTKAWTAGSTSGNGYLQRSSGMMILESQTQSAPTDLGCPVVEERSAPQPDVIECEQCPPASAGTTIINSEIQTHPAPAALPNPTTGNCPGPASELFPAQQGLSAPIW